MKGYTSRLRFDEHRRFTSVQEQMGRVRLDADANEQALLIRTDARRRSSDLAEGSPDDGFRICDTHLIDGIGTPAGWSGKRPGDEDKRLIRPELGLARRDPETLPHVIRVRGYREVIRKLPCPLDLLHLPLPAFGTSMTMTYAAGALVLPVRFLRPPTDDEITKIRIVVLDAAHTRHLVGSAITGNCLDDQWLRIRLPLAELDSLPRGTDDQGQTTLLLNGWGLTGLPPRAEIFFDGLEAEDDSLTENDFIIRGGDGTLDGSGRLYARGRRVFIETDWRYLRQPDLPSPAPLARPEDPDTVTHLVYLDIWERPVHGFQDQFLREPALDGEDTTFRIRKVSQVRVHALAAGSAPALPSPAGSGLLSTDIAEGTLPDRYPAEDFDPCRDRCLFTENMATGQGYRGTDNIHFRLEILRGGNNPLLIWSRNNAATVAPLQRDVSAGSHTVQVSSEHARMFTAGDIVVLEDEQSRLDPDRFPPLLRQLRSVDAAGGRLEFQPAGTTLPQPALVEVGGEVQRPWGVQDHAAVRRWDGADRLVCGVRYSLADGITFAFSGQDFRSAEYWTFTARITRPDGEAGGVVDTLTNEPVHGPYHERVALARIRWTDSGRQIDDLRQHFLPLQEVRHRLQELGRRHLAPGAFTVVVGDGKRTFGDFDQNLEENVTGDEVLQAALDRLGINGGTIYVRAGHYALEHTVLIQGRDRVRIIGDGEATELSVRGAGGAFYLDHCGRRQGMVVLENMRMVEYGREHVPVGTGSLPGGSSSMEGILAEHSIKTARSLVPADLSSSTGQVSDLVRQLAESVAKLHPGLGRTSASVVKTLVKLRRLQRLHPGKPLEEVAPELLEVLRKLPHGAVTISDCSSILLLRLSVEATGRHTDREVDVPAILLTGQCRDLTIDQCRIKAPSGIIAIGYGRYLTPQALIRRPRSGLFLNGIRISGNTMLHQQGRTGSGVSVHDGLLQNLQITDNRLHGFARGIRIIDRSEDRSERLDRSVVRENRIQTAGRVGIHVVCDGMDIEANEVQLAPGPDRFRTGIQISGRSIRVRDCRIVVQSGKGVLPGMDIEAGIVLGTGFDDGRVVARNCTDLEIAANHVEGGSGQGLCTGLLIGGAQPVFDVRMHGNTLQNLGDAGIRAWGYAGDVGRLQISDNRLQNVALGYPQWGAAHIDRIRSLAPQVGDTLKDNDDPRTVLNVLLDASGSGLRPALDCMLRWLETTTLRGGILLSLVEESEIRGNRITGTGIRQVPASLKNMAIRTSGIATVGGLDSTVHGNVIRDVQGAVTSRELPKPRPKGKPPIFEFLNPLGAIGRTEIPKISDIRGSIVALRRDILAYARGDRSQRQRLGGRIYAAMEAVETALEERGREGARLARELSDGIATMRAAQGLQDHTRAANLVRAVLSDAACLTAARESAATVWRLAARFDHSLLADKNAVAEMAAEVAEHAKPLLKDLEELKVDLAASAQAVLEAPEDRNAQLRLAAHLGIVAEARGREAELRQAMPEEGLTSEDRTMLDGMVTLLNNRLKVKKPQQITDQELKLLDEGARTLAGQLKNLHTEYARRLTLDLSRLKKTKGKNADPELTRLRETVADIKKLADDPASGTKVRRGDLAASEKHQQAELIVLGAEQIDRRLAALSLVKQSSAIRELRVLGKTAGQLVNLLADEPVLLVKAREVERDIHQAIRDPEHRLQYQAAARKKLQDLQREQSRLAGVKVSVAREEPVLAKIDLAGRLAGMGQLLLALRAERDEELRKEGIRLFDLHVHQAAEQLDIGPAVRAGLLHTLATATSSFLDDRESEDEALFALADVLNRLAGEAADRPEADVRVKAVRSLNSALAHALDPDSSEEDKVRRVRRWIRHNRKVLSGSIEERFTSVSTVADILQATATGLAGITGVRGILSPAGAVPVPLLISPSPADGLFASGVLGRIDWQDNHIGQVRIGGAVVGGKQHILATLAQEVHLVLTVQGNRVSGAAVAGFRLRPDGHGPVSVTGNRVSGCGGIHVPQPSPYGQAIMELTGQGELLCLDNLLYDNGSRDIPSVQHELLVQWQGDIRVAGNRIRHGGGRDGGCALLLVLARIDSELVARLSRKPALDIEAPPKLAQQQTQDSAGAGNIDDFLLAGLGKNAALLGSRGSFTVGALQMQALEARPLYDRLRMVPRPVVTGKVAKDRAGRWLAERVVVHDPLLDFLRQRPPRFFKPFLPLQRFSLHLTGNDIVANGPALLALADEGILVSATVVGNELESLAATGAVYLRSVDATVFSGNRCECTSEVNVVVVRTGKSQVSITGNTITGAEPTTPPASPLPPAEEDGGESRPMMPREPGINLSIDMGLGREVRIPLNSKEIRKAIDASTEKTFSRTAEEAATEFKQFMVERKWKVLTKKDIDSARRSAESGQPTEIPEKIASLLKDTTLRPQSRLYGVYLAAGRSEREAKEAVRVQMMAAAGDGERALQRGVHMVLGIGYQEESGRESGRRPLLEQILDIAIRQPHILAPQRPVRPPLLQAPAPDPREHSLVIIGGSRVGAINNITTAGVHIHDAGQSIAHNL